MDNSICTVLIVTYNHKNYIKHAIESVLEQETQYKFKIHIFDDGSTDGTKDIINDYAQKHPEIITPFISETNQGPQANFWSAYKSVDTKYCAMLEGDDYWCDKQKLELQISALEAHPECSFSAHNTRMVNLNDTIRKGNNNKLLISASQVRDKNIVEYKDIEYVKYGFMNHAASRVLRTSCYNLDEIKYKEAFLYDNNQFYYMLLKGSMYFIDRVMNIYNQTGTGDFSSKEPYHRISIQLERLADFNKETNYVIEDKICRDGYQFSQYYMLLQGKMEFKQKPNWYKILRKIRKFWYYMTPPVLSDILIKIPRRFVYKLKYLRRR